MERQATGHNTLLSDAAYPTSRRTALGSKHGKRGGVKGRLKILFLGGRYNQLTLSCLLALARSGHDVVVGEYSPTVGSLWPALRDILRSRGFLFVVRKTFQVLRSEMQVIFRRLRFPMQEFASRTDLILAHKLRTIPCTNPNDPDFVRKVQELKVDLIVVAGLSRILKAQLIEIPRLRCINVHASLLPRYRGPNPYYWVLAKHESNSGVTLHYIDTGIDSGNVIMQREFAIDPGETETTLRAKASVVAAELLSETIPLLATGTAPSIPQDESKASYYPHPSKKASGMQRCQV